MMDINSCFKMKCYSVYWQEAVESASLANGRTRFVDGAWLTAIYDSKGFMKQKILENACDLMPF